MPKIEQGVHVQSYSSPMPQSSSHPTTPTPPNTTTSTPPTTATYIPRSLPRGIGFIDFPGSDPSPPVRSDLVWRSVDSYLPSANAVLCDAPVGAMGVLSVLGYLSLRHFLLPHNTQGLYIGLVLEYQGTTPLFL